MILNRPCALARSAILTAAESTWMSCNTTFPCSKCAGRNCTRIPCTRISSFVWPGHLGASTTTDSTVKFPQPFQCALVTAHSAPLSLLMTVSMTQFNDDVKRSKHHSETNKAKAEIEILRRAFQAIWTEVRKRLVSLLRSNTFSFYRFAN